MVAGSAQKFTSSEGFRALKVELALALRLTGPVTLESCFSLSLSFPRCSVDVMKVFTSSSDKYHNTAGLVLHVRLMNEDTQWVA